jgi:pimeloyl-ACP methyl ester carboxylesterase
MVLRVQPHPSWPSRLGVTAGFADLNGGRHYYEALGAGPALVFVPGFTLDTRMWDAQFETFARDYRVVRYDLPGAGRSDPPSRPYAFHDDLRALLDHLAIPDAHVVGLSLGGSIAVEFALAYPERTRSLVGVDVSGLPGYPWPPELQAFFAELDVLGRDDVVAAKDRWFASAWFTPAMRKPEAAAALHAIAADYSGWHFRNRNPVRRLKPPPGERLAEIAAPTLVLVGLLDLDFYNLPLAAHLAASIHGARKVELEGVGHLPNMEDPARFNHALQTFVENVERTHGT